MKVKSQTQWTIELGQAEAEALRCVLNFYLHTIDKKIYDEEVAMDDYSFLKMNEFVAEIIDNLPEAL